MNITSIYEEGKNEKVTINYFSGSYDFFNGGVWTLR